MLLTKTIKLQNIVQTISLLLELAPVITNLPQDGVKVMVTVSNDFTYTTKSMIIVGSEDRC
jgi:hypothetical protein